MHHYNFKISGITFDTWFKPSEEMAGNIGLANFNAQTISINNDQSPQTKRIAAWHEIIHIMDSIYGLGLSEEQVIRLAHAMVGFFEDNQHLVDDKGLWHE